MFNFNRVIECMASGISFPETELIFMDYALRYLKKNYRAINFSRILQNTGRVDTGQ
jgi:hypothetical protein